MVDMSGQLFRLKAPFNREDGISLLLQRLCYPQQLTQSGFTIKYLQTRRLSNFYSPLIKASRSAN